MATTVGSGQHLRRIHTFVDTLKVDEKIKDELKKVTPYNYVGYS